MTNKRSKQEVSQLIEQYQGIVKEVMNAHFYSYHGNDDFYQAGLIGLWEAAQKWGGHGSFEAYAKKSIYHNMIDYQRTLDREDRVVKLSYRESDRGDDGTDYGGDICWAEELPTECLPTIREDELLENEELIKKVTALYPAGSVERKVLLSLAKDTATKKQLAEEMGTSTYTITKLARKAYRELKEAFREE